MEQKRSRENQEGGSVEQTIENLFDLYGADLAQLQEVQTIVTRMADLYGMDALFALEEWKKCYAQNNIERFREIGGIIANICEEKGGNAVRQFCSLGMESWQQIDFSHFQLIISVLILKGDVEAFALMKIFLDGGFDFESSEQAVRFLFQFGPEVTTAIFKLFHLQAREDYLNLVWDIMMAGEVTLGRSFLWTCVAKNLTTEQATNLFSKLMAYINQSTPDIAACEDLLKAAQDYTLLH